MPGSRSILCASTAAWRRARGRCSSSPTSCRPRSSGRLRSRAPPGVRPMPPGWRAAFARRRHRWPRIGGGRAVNLLSPLPDARAAEVAEILLARPGLRIARIVSLGQQSPPGFWYDQDEGEWVVLLAGAARLRFADEAEERLLRPGDVVDIAPHRRHRVEWTDPATPTVWLAVFYGAK